MTLKTKGRLTKEHGEWGTSMVNGEGELTENGELTW